MELRPCTAAVIVSPDTFDVGDSCACAPVSFDVTNDTGGPLDGHRLTLALPAPMKTRSVSLVYGGGAAGITTASAVDVVVATWPDGGVVSVACEICPGCEPIGTYVGTVDVGTPAGIAVASVPVTINRA